MVAHSDPEREAMEKPNHYLTLGVSSVESQMSDEEAEKEQTRWALMRSFKGVSDTDIEAGHGALMLGFRVYFTLVMLLIGYRNIFFDPTLPGVLVTLNTLVAILITMAHFVETAKFRVNRRHQIFVIALMMIVSSVIIQYRNPTWPAISFVTALPTSVLILVLVGSWPAVIIHLLYCFIWSIIVLSSGSLALIPMIAVAIGVYPLPLMLMIFMAVALQTRERNSEQLRLAQRRLASRVDARNVLISQLKEELTIPLQAIKALPHMAAVSHQALIKQANDISKELSGQLEALRGSLEIEESDLCISPSPARVSDLLEELRRRIQPRATAKGLVFDVGSHQLLADTYEFDAKKMQFALVSLIESEAAHPEITFMSLTASCQQKTDQIHTLHIKLTFDSQLPAEIANHYFPAGQCAPPHEDKLAAINNDLSPFTLVATLLDLMGGSLHYQESDDTAESSYHIVLPLKTCSERDAEATNLQRETCFAGLRFAVVDHDPLVARMVQSLLISGGSDSVEIAPARDAVRIQKLAGRAVDVLLFDSSNLQLPIDRFVKLAVNSEDQVRLIAMHPIASDATRPSSSKISAFIPRPPTFGALKAAIESLDLTAEK